MQPVPPSSPHLTPPSSPGPEPKAKKSRTETTAQSEPANPERAASTYKLFCQGAAPGGVAVPPPVVVAPIQDTLDQATIDARMGAFLGNTVKNQQLVMSILMSTMQPEIITDYIDSIADMKPQLSAFAQTMHAFLMKAGAERLKLQFKEIVNAGIAEAKVISPPTDEAIETTLSFFLIRGLQGFSDSLMAEAPNYCARLMRSMEQKPATLQAIAEATIYLQNLDNEEAQVLKLLLDMEEKNATEELFPRETGRENAQKILDILVNRSTEARKEILFPLVRDINKRLGITVTSTPEATAPQEM